MSSTDLVSQAEALKTSATGAVRKTLDGILPEGSDFKTKKEDKDTKKEAITAEKPNVIIIESARLNKGAYKPNNIDPVTSTPADYYRNGRLVAKDAGTQTLSNEYDYNPRFLQDPEKEDIASIRLLGMPKDKSKTEPQDLIPPFSKFFLESYQEGHMERSQIVETFGDFYVFFFGERPPVYNFSGTLLNTKDINWKEDFMFYYDKFLRGTKCVEYKAKILLTYGLNQIEGFILSVNMQANAANEKGVQVSWQVLVTDRKQMRLSLDFGITEENGKFNQDNSILNLLNRGSSDPTTSDSTKKAKDFLTKKENASKAKVLKTADLKKVKSSAPNANFSVSGGKIIKT